MGSWVAPGLQVPAAVAALHQQAVGRIARVSSHRAASAKAGLAFHVTVKEKENVAYDYSRLRRDVGVAYIRDYNDTSGSRVNTFGSFIQPQPAVFDNSSATAARYFAGDALNIAFYGSNRLFINSNSGATRSFNEQHMAQNSEF